MIDKKHLYEVMEKGVDELFALCQKFEEENAALSKDLDRQVELNHVQLQEIERLRALIGRCEDNLNKATQCANNVIFASVMGSTTFVQGVSARDYIDKTLAAIREII